MFGRLIPPVWNERTGRLVGGHQRLLIRDDQEKGKDYEIAVAVVDFDEDTERQCNVFLNNRNAQGAFDQEKLFQLFGEYKFKADDLGFTAIELECEFGELPPVLMGDAPAAPKPAEQIAAELEKLKAARKQIKSAKIDSIDVDYYVAVHFGTPKKKRAWLEEHGLDQRIESIDIVKFEEAMNSREAARS